MTVEVPTTVEVTIPLATTQVTDYIPIYASGDTDAVVTVPQNIPNGIYSLREKLAVMFSSVQDMPGDIYDNLEQYLYYVPDEYKTALGFGVTVVTAVGLFKLFFR